MNTQTKDDSHKLQYVLTNEEAHVMNAQVETECSTLYLKAVNYVSAALKIKSEIETKALYKGSVVRVFRFIVNEKKNNEALRYVLMFVFNKIFYCRQMITIKDILENLNEEEYDCVLSVLQSKNITDASLSSLYSHLNLRNTRSHFFKNLYNDREISSFSIMNGIGYSFDDQNKKLQILSDKFKEYIEEDDTSLTITKDQVLLYITSPVLLKGKEIKWGGVYENEYITYEMLSSEFKTKAQIGEIDFRTGFNISCKLEYKEVIDEMNKIKRKDFKVIEVYSHCIDNMFVETFAGKKKRVEENSPKLFDDSFFQ